MTTPKRLTDLELDEVSCVDAPANQGARVVLFKQMDPLNVALAKARNTVTRGEAAEAVKLAKANLPAPEAYWRAALATLAKQHTAPGIPPAMAGQLALMTEDGKALLAALARATT